MKKILTIILVLLSVSIFSQNIGINADGSLPNQYSILDIKSNTSGLLIPRLTSLEISAIAGGSPGATEESMLVYQTDGITGFYYWDNTEGMWKPLFTEKFAWSLTGNSNTDPGTGTAPDQNFIGTKDAKDLVFATDYTERIRILSTGDVRLFGTTSGYIGFKASAVAGSTTYTLPSADGTVGSVLITNGAGTLSFKSIGGVRETIYKGTFSRVTNGTIAANPNTANTVDVPGDAYVAGFTNSSTTGLYYSCMYASVYTALNNDVKIIMPKCVVTKIHIVLGAASTTTGSSTFSIVNSTTSVTSNFIPAIAAGSAVGMYNVTGNAVFSDGDLLSVKNLGSNSVGVLYIERIEIIYYLIP